MNAYSRGRSVRRIRRKITTCGPMSGRRRKWSSINPPCPPRHDDATGDAVLAVSSVTSAKETSRVPTRRRFWALFKSIFIPTPVPKSIYETRSRTDRAGFVLLKITVDQSFISPSSPAPPPPVRLYPIRWGSEMNSVLCGTTLFYISAFSPCSRRVFNSRSISCQALPLERNFRK